MVRLVLVAAIGFAGLSSAPAFADDAQSAQGKLLLVMDSSGSMKATDGGPTSRIAAAKQALGAVVDRLPADSTVGLRVYGATVFSKKDPGACKDSQLVVPIGKADKPALRAAIGRYKPYGETPMAHSLLQAAKDLGDEGQRTIVLVSDGEETCDPNPCKVAKTIHDKGIDLKIDVVGLRVSGKAESQLKCIADAGGGTYYSANDADQLTRGIVRLAVRAFRPFQVSGTPIEGGMTVEKAPAISAGQFTDVLGSSGSSTGGRYYRVKRTTGASLYVAATGRPGPVNDQRPLQVRILTPDGHECANADTWVTGSFEEYFDTTSIVTTTAAWGNDPTTTDDDKCELGELIVDVFHGQRGNDKVVGRGEMPFELVVTEEPPVRNPAQYNTPVGAGIDTKVVVPRTKNLSSSGTGEATGGVGLSDAGTLTPGTWTDSIRPGEQIFYRVKADWGQAPQVSVRFGPEINGGNSGYLGPLVQMETFSPHRAKMNNGANSETYTGQAHPDVRKPLPTLNAAFPTVKYDNRFSSASGVGPASVAGYYYFSLEMGKEKTYLDWQVPLEISVRLEGQPIAAPEYLELAKPTPAPTPSADKDKGGQGGDAQKGKTPTADSNASTALAASSSNSTMLAILVALAVVVLLLGVVTVLVRRRN